MGNKLEVGMSGLKIIGAGFGRTGTASLQAILEDLGFGPCYHMTELFRKPEHMEQWEAAIQGATIDWHDLFKGYQATVDWPACSFYEDLMQAYPHARVVLTVRDPESWYESVRSSIYAIHCRASRIRIAPLLFFLMGTSAPRWARVYHLSSTLIWKGTFGSAFENRTQAIAVFNQHNETVKKRVPPDKLLVYDVKEGWEPLCSFLGVEVPWDRPFPHLNIRSDFIGNKFWQQATKQLTLVLVAVGALLVGWLIRRIRLKGKIERPASSWFLDKSGVSSLVLKAFCLYLFVEEEPI